MKKVRIGIVGMGNMGKFHAQYITSGKVPRAELTAVSDSYTANLEAWKGKVATFETRRSKSPIFLRLVSMVSLTS